jgi:hypothetical protein
MLIKIGTIVAYAHHRKSCMPWYIMIRDKWYLVENLCTKYEFQSADKLSKVSLKWQVMDLNSRKMR